MPSEQKLMPSHGHDAGLEVVPDYQHSAPEVATSDAPMVVPSDGRDVPEYFDSNKHGASRRTNIRACEQDVNDHKTQLSDDQLFVIYLHKTCRLW